MYSKEQKGFPVVYLSKTIEIKTRVKNNFQFLLFKDVVIFDGTTWQAETSCH